MAKEDDKLSTEAKVARETGPAFNALTQLISATVAGALIGWGLDRFGVTSGQGKIWGPVIGGVVGLGVFIYTASKIKTQPPPKP